jgi:hypothetical protein
MRCIERLKYSLSGGAESLEIPWFWLVFTPVYRPRRRRSRDGGSSYPSTIQTSDRTLAIDVANVRSLAMESPRMPWKA